MSAQWDLTSYRSRVRGVVTGEGGMLLQAERRKIVTAAPQGKQNKTKQNNNKQKNPKKTKTHSPKTKNPSRNKSRFRKKIYARQWTIIIIMHI